MFWQQGDVLFHDGRIPKDAMVSELKDGIVQFGEATGHAHRLYGNGYEMLRDKSTGERYLRVVKPTMLKHEEHKPIEIPPGEYRIGIVKEYDHFTEEAREVVD